MGTEEFSSFSVSYATLMYAVYFCGFETYIYLQRDLAQNGLLNINENYTSSFIIQILLFAALSLLYFLFYGNIEVSEVIFIISELACLELARFYLGISKWAKSNLIHAFKWLLAIAVFLLFSNISQNIFLALTAANVTTLVFLSKEFRSSFTIRLSLNSLINLLKFSVVVSIASNLTRIPFVYDRLLLEDASADSLDKYLILMLICTVAINMLEGAFVQNFVSRILSLNALESHGKFILRVGTLSGFFALMISIIDKFFHILIVNAFFVFIFVAVSVIGSLFKYLRLAEGKNWEIFLVEGIIALFCVYRFNSMDIQVNQMFYSVVVLISLRSIIYILLHEGTRLRKVFFAKLL